MAEGILTEAEAHRVSYVATTLCINREELVIKVCQLKSHIGRNAAKFAELKNQLMATVRSNLTDMTSFMKLIYGLVGIVGIAFAVEVAGLSATGIALFVLSFFFLYVGLSELKKLLLAFWAKLQEQISAVTLGL